MARLRSLVGTFALAFVLVLTGVPATPASAALPADFCAAQVAAVRKVDGQISHHNSQPRTFTLPRQAAAYARYNARAAKLNAQAKKANANLKSCMEAMVALGDPQSGSPEMPRLAPPIRAELLAAQRQMPKVFTPPPPPAAGRSWRVTKGSPLRPFYDALRDNTPNAPGGYGDAVRTLQGMKRPAPGAPDWAYPPSSGRVLGVNANGGAAVSPDHIVPLARIIRMRNFHKLTPESMWAVVNAPRNLQWLSFGANWSKGSKSVGSITSMDKAFRDAQVKLENARAAELQALIDKLVKSQSK